MLCAYGMLLGQSACELIAARKENQDAGLKPGATFKPKATAAVGCGKERESLQRIKSAAFDAPYGGVEFQWAKSRSLKASAKNAVRDDNVKTKRNTDCAGSLGSCESRC